MAHFREALKITPADAQVHYNFGVVLAERGRSDEAIAHFREAVKAKPDYAEAHFNLGGALARCGRMDEATDHYRKALVFARQQDNAALVEASQARLRTCEAGTAAPALSPPSAN